MQFSKDKNTILHIHRASGSSVKRWRLDASAELETIAALGTGDYHKSMMMSGETIVSATDRNKLVVLFTSWIHCIINFYYNGEYSNNKSRIEKPCRKLKK